MSGPSKAAVSRALRVAGLKRSTWSASSMVRGWGEWSSGYYFDGPIEGRIIVVARAGGNFARPADHAAIAAQMAKALTAAGIRHERAAAPNGHVLRVLP